MLTSEYKYFQCEFSEFNPVQEAAYPYFTKDCNLVVGSTMSSGKTSIAECIMGYEIQRDSKSIVCYVSPLKALSNQMNDEWRDSTLSKNGMTLITGDDDGSVNSVNSLVIATIEALDVKIRKKTEWINRISCFVLDEAHLIGHLKRGSDAEALIMGLTYTNPSSRIIFLSGTLSNADEIAKWLKQLNGKNTYCIKSDWTPVKVNKRIHVTENNSEMYSFIEDEVSRNIYNKTLVFVHSKKQGETITRYLLEKGYRAAFYHASLSFTKRKKIAGNFKDEFNDMNILITTNALGLGLNL